MTLAIGASNAFGLVTGALLLGFGLVEIPRNLWRHADLDARQKWLSHKVAKVADKLDEAHQELSTAVVVRGAGRCGVFAARFGETRDREN